jgi:Rrf2 family protein
MARARGLNFRGINVDLIYGLPAQTIESFSATMHQVESLAPDRIALYGYAHVPWLKRVQKTFERSGLPSPAERIKLFALACATLQKAGYLQIGMDHFALQDDELAAAYQQGYLRRNFMGYTVRRSDYLIGFGVSAISGLPSAMAQNKSSLEEYMGSWNIDTPAIGKGTSCSEDDRIRADVIQSLFCSGSVEMNKIGEYWGIQFEEYFSAELDQIQELAHDNLVSVSNQQISLVPGTEHFIRYVASTFDAYLQRHSASILSRGITEIHMLLSQTAEYAIRATSWIVLHESDTAVRAKDISKNLGIPAPYLSKILRRLVEAEILTAAKGHQGGFKLARQSRRVRVLDVVEAVEDAIPARHCIFGWRTCSAKKPCVLHHRWSQVNDTFQEWLRTTTLADIKEDAAQLQWLHENSQPPS